jgi:AmiR/NasT family two-component response regulator
MAKNVCVSVSKEDWERAKDKNISWSEALHEGIRAILDKPFYENDKEHIDYESEISKRENAIRFLQKAVEDLQSKLEEVKNVNQY